MVGGALSTSLLGNIQGVNDGGFCVEPVADRYYFTSPLKIKKKIKDNKNNKYSICSFFNRVNFNYDGLVLLYQTDISEVSIPHVSYFWKQKTLREQSLAVRLTQRKTTLVWQEMTTEFHPVW